MAFIEFLCSKKCFSNVFNLEMKWGYVESPNTEIAVSRVNCESFCSSGTITEPGIVLVATITSGRAILGTIFLAVCSHENLNFDAVSLVLS
jgi:hypothetical protein